MIMISPLVATAAYMAGRESITPEEPIDSVPVVVLPPAGVGEGSEPESMLFLSPAVVDVTQPTLVVAPVHYESDPDDGVTIAEEALDACYPLHASLREVTPADDSSLAEFTTAFANATFEFDFASKVVTVTRPGDYVTSVSLADLADDPSAARVVKLIDSGWTRLVFKLLPGFDASTEG